MDWGVCNRTFVSDHWIKIAIWDEMNNMNNPHVIRAYDIGTAPTL